MNLRQSQDNQAKRDLWNNRRLAEEQIIFCVRGSEIVESPFKAGTVQWELPLFFIADRKRQTMKLWLSSTMHDKEELPTKWDDLLSGVTEWPAHNVMLVMNVPGNPQKGYHFEFPQRSVDDCPCKHFQPKPAEALPEANIVEGSLVEVNEILTGMDFEALPVPATDAQKRWLLTTSSFLKSKGLVVDPGNLDIMTEPEAARRIAEMQIQLDAARKEWLQKSAIAGTQKL